MGKRKGRVSFYNEIVKGKRKRIKLRSCKTKENYKIGILTILLQPLKPKPPNRTVPY